MTTINEAKETLLSYFNENWTETPIAYDNKNDKYASSSSPWVRAVVRMTSGGQESLGSEGNRIFRRQGLLIFQVFTLAGKGTETSDTLVQDILDLFDGKNVGYVNIINGSPTYTGTDGKWYQQNVQFTIIFDEIK